MGKITFSPSDVLTGFKKADRRTGMLRKTVPNGYVDVSEEVKGLITSGLVQEFFYDDVADAILVTDQEKNPILGKDGKQLVRYELRSIETDKAKFNRLAGADNVQITNLADMKTAKELVNSAS